MAVGQVNETNSDVMVSTLRRIEATLQALPDELSAARVTTLSEEEAKDILAKRHARINNWQQNDNKNLRSHRRVEILQQSMVLLVLLAIAAGVFFTNFG